MFSSKLTNNVKVGRVCWITGLSGVGKSTLAREVATRLRAKNEPVVVLDGDELRQIFGAVTSSKENYSREGRLALAMKYSYLSKLIALQGFTVIVATISLFNEIHAWNRGNLPGYFEVYLKLPLAELRRRDPKGIYRGFDAGELTDVAGLDLPIDEPKADWIPDLMGGETVDTLTRQLIDIFERKNYE